MESSADQKIAAQNKLAGFHHQDQLPWKISKAIRTSANMQSAIS
jgi:hypothetical protein